jgi:hypothetical protein
MKNTGFEHCISHWMPRPCVSPRGLQLTSAACESPQAHSGCVVGHSKTGCSDTIYC